VPALDRMQIRTTRKGEPGFCPYRLIGDSSRDKLEISRRDTATGGG